MKIKIDKADKLFSTYIRARDNWTCNRCHTQYEEKAQGLHNSHYYGRGNECTRFDPQNCDALCFFCHQQWDSNKEDYRDFKIKQLGEQGFNALRVRASSTCKKDRNMSYLIVKELMRVLTKANNKSKI